MVTMMMMGMVVKVVMMMMLMLVMMVVMMIAMAMKDLRAKVEESEYCFYRNLPENPSSSPSQLVNTKVDNGEQDDDSLGDAHDDIIRG